MLGVANIPWTVPLSLVVMLVASVAVFWMLVRRATVQRQWMEISDWAERNRLRFCGQKDAVRPEAIRLFGDDVRVLMSLNDQTTSIVQVETSTPPGGVVGRAMRWNLLVRRLEYAWPTATLRPVSRPISAADYLPLGSMYGTIPGERFVAYGAERAATIALADSTARGLLPPDITLVLLGKDMILDFSTRPFDTLTLARMESLARQIVVHLPKREG